MSGLTSTCECGVRGVFCITGRSRLTFPTAYDKYTSQITTLDEDIARYLRVSLDFMLC